MTSSRITRCLLALALLALPSGCALKPPGEGREAGEAGVREGRVVSGEESVREGLEIGLEGIDYNVFITRQLNPRDPEDNDYYPGPEAPANTILLGVFLQACNRGESPAETASEFKLVDTQGAEVRPLALEPENIFAYRAGRLDPTTCIPNQYSTVRYAPTGGAVLVFPVPIPMGENRPIELEIEPPSGRGAPAKVELDV